MNVVVAQPWYRQVTPANWRTLVGCWVGWALDGFDFILITYVLTDIAKAFNLSLTIAGTLILATFATRWLGGAFFGSLADRFGRKKIMILGILCYSLATFLCGLSWDYWSLLAFRLFVGLGMAGEYAAGTTLLLESWPLAQRNKGCGLLVSGWGVGGIASAFIYPLVVPTYGWRALFFIGLLPALVTLYIRRNIPETPEWIESRRISSSQQPRGPSFFQLFSRQWFPITSMLFLSMFAYFAMCWPVFSLMPTYLKSIGYAPQGVGNIMQIANVGAMLGYCFSGFLSDWLKIRWTIVSMSLSGLIMVVLTFTFATSGPIMLGVLVFMLVFTNAGVGGIWPLYVAEQFGVGVRSAGLGVVYNLGSLAGGLSPVWAAVLANWIGLGPALGALMFFWTLVAVAIVGFELPRRVRTAWSTTTIAPEVAAVADLTTQ